MRSIRENIRTAVCMYEPNEVRYKKLRYEYFLVWTELTVIKQNLSDIFKCHRYFVNEKKRMRKRQYDNNWESEKRRKVSKLHNNVCKFENICKALFNKLVCRVYDPEMGVFQITEMTYRAMVENIQTDTEDNAFEISLKSGVSHELHE